MHSIDIRKRIAILLVLLCIAAIWYFISSGNAADSAALQASGTVEAEAVSLASELSGRIAEVLVDEGQAITAGEIDVPSG